VSDVFLGVIAGSVLLMAVLQLAALVLAARTAKRVDALVARLEHDVRPILDALQALSTEAARVVATAAVQVDRADEMLGVLRERLDDAVRVVQVSLLKPARDIGAMLQALREIFFKGPAGPAGYDSRKRQAEEEDALFIG
jgi:hypothetical protein